MKYYLQLGSNDGDRELHLHNALSYLEEICESCYSSTHYASPALGGGKPFYLNSVALVETPILPDRFNILLKKCEFAEGRDETARREQRVPLDIDIVISNGEIIRPNDFRQYFFRKGFEELNSLFTHPAELVK